MAPHPQFDVVGFGALNIDLIFRVEDDFLVEWELRPGEEVASPRFSRDELMAALDRRGQLLGRSGGGSAANAAVALARTGHRVGYLGKVGLDHEGQFLMDSMESVCIDSIRRENRSGLCVSLLPSSTADRVLLVFPGANDSLRSDDVDVHIANRSRFVHLTSFVGDAPFEAQKAVVLTLDDEVSVSFDPGILYARRGLDALLPILKRCSVMFPSREEVELLTGEPWEQGCESLRMLGGSIVACTLGADGSFVISDQGAFLQPAPQVTVQDTTGAGDVYAAGFLAGLLAGNTIRECAELATRWAVKSITGLGRSLYPSKSDFK
jgi:ribokinase